MKVRSAQECINRILRDIEKRRNVHPMDFQDRNFVRRYNAAMDRIKENVDYLNEHHPDQMDLFINLVNSPDPLIASHCAHLLYGMEGSTMEQKRLALAVLKRLINHPDISEPSRCGMLMNIKQWEAEMEIQST